MQSREDCKSSRIPTAPVKPAAMLEERGASANRTQADLRECLMSSSSQEPRASGKPAAMFSLGSEKTGNQFKSSVFKHADPSNLGKSLLEGSKDHLLSQARSELMRQEHQVGALNNFISELKQQAYAQRLELQDAHHGFIESRREQVRLQEEFSMKEKVLRHTQIRSMHDLGEMKRAQELRVDEVSVQKLRENHVTIQKLTSQLQEMQDQMNSMNDSGEFQEVESNYSGRLSYVSSQPAMIPSSLSMLSRDKRLPLDTWNTSGLQENVFGNQFFTFGSSRHHHQGIPSCETQREQGSVPQAAGTGTLFTREDKQNKGTIPMPTFARRSSTISSLIPVDFPQKSMVGQQRQANFGAAIRQIP